VVLGVLAWRGRKLAALLPAASGLAAWAWALVASVTPVLVLLAVLVLTGFLLAAELRALVRRGGASPLDPGARPDVGRSG